MISSKYSVWAEFAAPVTFPRKNSSLAPEKPTVGVKSYVNVCHWLSAVNVAENRDKLFAPSSPTVTGRLTLLLALKDSRYSVPL